MTRDASTTISRVATVPEHLPGQDLVEQGLRDLRAGRETESALLVLIAAPRLRALGIEIPEYPDKGEDSPAHRLYDILSSSPAGGAHSRYNALLARITSFASAAEHAAPS